MRFGTPRQATCDSGLEGEGALRGQQQAIIELNRGCNFDTAARDLTGFDYIWLVTVHHLQMASLNTRTALPHAL